jgi:hypothetical protein
VTVPAGAATGIANASWKRTASAHPQNVGELRNAIVAFAAQHGADGDKQAKIALASSGALTNAVVHAFVGRAPGTEVEDGSAAVPGMASAAGSSAASARNGDQP